MSDWNFKEAIVGKDRAEVIWEFDEFINRLKKNKRSVIEGGFEEGESVDVIKVEDLDELAGSALTGEKP